MLSNAYFLAKFRFDTDENEPAKNLQNFANFPNFANPNDGGDAGAERRVGDAARAGPQRQGPRGGALAGGPRGLDRPDEDRARQGLMGPSWGEGIGGRGSKIGKFCKFLAGSFSAVSKRNFARKYAFDSIFQALQDLHTSAPLQSQKFSKKNRFEKSALFRCCK